jgi:ATP-dependent DNA ligase
VVVPLPDTVRFSEAFRRSARKFMQVVREKGLKGIVAKRRDSTYQAEALRWLDKRCERIAEEFVKASRDFARSALSTAPPP